VLVREVDKILGHESVVQERLIRELSGIGDGVEETAEYIGAWGWSNRKWPGGVAIVIRRSLTRRTDSHWTSWLNSILTGDGSEMKAVCHHSVACDNENVDRN
jgi:hypothetical protein